MTIKTTRKQCIIQPSPWNVQATLRPEAVLLKNHKFFGAGGSSEIEYDCGAASTWRLEGTAGTTAMDDIFPFLIIGGFILFAVVTMIWSAKAEKKRIEELRQFAADMGLEFVEQGDLAQLGPFSGFKLFGRGRKRTVKGLIQGVTEDVSIRLFDYYFTTGHGKRRRVHRQTVACLQSAGLDLTPFTMRPQGVVFDALGKVFGGKDIDFDDHPLFSRMFVLQGPDESAIRDLFRPEVLEFFETQPKISVEASHEGLIFYRQNRRIPPTEMGELFRQTYEVFAVLRDSNPSFERR